MPQGLQKAPYGSREPAETAEGQRAYSAQKMEQNEQGTASLQDTSAGTFSAARLLPVWGLLFCAVKRPSRYAIMVRLKTNMFRKGEIHAVYKRAEQDGKGEVPCTEGKPLLQHRAGILNASSRRKAGGIVYGLRPCQ